jgi:hypothetical protein
MIKIRRAGKKRPVETLLYIRVREGEDDGAEFDARKSSVASLSF